MDLKKLNPWNWFKHEESGERAMTPPSRSMQRGELGTFQPMLSLHQEIDRLFDHTFRSFGLPAFGFGGSLLDSSTFRPNMDIEASEHEYRLTAELPGVEERDVEVDVSPDGTLTIRGEKRQEREERGRSAYRAERAYGAFQRVLALPDDADRDNIEARFKNGVLSLTIPRKLMARPDVRRISVKAE